MTPEENARRMREAIEKTGWTPPQPQPAQPSWAALASNPALAVGLRFNLGNQPLERFARGLMKPLPDNAVPDFAKPMQSDWEAKPGTMRRAVGDWLSRPGEPGESWPLIGPAGPMVRQMGGAILNDPIEALSEFSGYAPASRAFDAGAQALDEEDPVAAAGQWARSLGEGGMAAATVAGNAYGLGSLGAKAYRGGPVAALPDADMAGLKGRLAKAQTAGPSQIQTLIDDAGARAAAAESRIKPVDWSQVEMPEPAAAASAPQAPRDWAINIEGRTAPGRLRPRPEPDAYTPLDMTPEEQAAIDLSRQYQGRTSMWDQPSLSPAGPRAPAALSPEQKAAMNAEIERLALQAEDAGKAGDTGAVAKAHEDIASIMARTGRPLETSPRLQAIQDRIDAIDRELKTADGAWREEELLAEADALMNERRGLRGKAPRQGALGNSSTLGMSGGNLWDDSGTSVADSIGNFVRKLRKSPAGGQEPTFRASEPNLTFGGERAATADTGALAKAQELDAAGAPREDIWAETGWFKGVDGKWRFEIDDSRATDEIAQTARELALEDVDRDRLTTGMVLNHKKLFEAYPVLDNLPVSIHKYLPNGAPGYLDGSPRMFLSETADVGTVLHEGQHGIQRYEKFARGGSPSNMLSERVDEINKQLSDLAKEMDYVRGVRYGKHPSSYPEYDAQLAELKKRYDDLLDLRSSETGPEARWAAYNRLAGEVEARNVQTRRDWTPEQRRETPPWMSQDIPDEQQIVTFGNGVAEANDAGPTILGSNGGGLFEGRRLTADSVSAAERTKVLKQFNDGEISRSEAMERAGYNSPGAFYRAAGKVKTTGAIRDRGQWESREKQGQQQTRAAVSKTPFRIFADREPEAPLPEAPIKAPKAEAFRVDKDAVANEARAIMDEFGYIPRDYVTQIAGRLGLNRNSVGRAIFNMKLAKDPRVKGLPEWNDEANLMSTPVGKAASAGLVAGTTYLPARLAADFASDAQEDGTLPAWMANLPRDPVHARPGL